MPNIRETAPGMDDIRPISPLESERESPPPGASGDINNNADREPSPPSQTQGRIEEEPPSPTLGPAADDLGPPGHDSDAEPPLPDPDSDEDPPPDPDSDEDPPPDPDSDCEESPPPPHDPPGPNSGEDDPRITLERMRTDEQFIRMAREATLRSQFTSAQFTAFLNPQGDEPPPSDEDGLLLSVKFYIASLDHAQSQRAYTKSRSIILECFPGSKMLSYDQVKRRVSEYSGVVTWKHDMCINSCVGFTGPYAELETCPDARCQEPRYDQEQLRKSGGRKKVARKEFTTFALGPQLQARWRNPQTAQKMFYRQNKTQEELARDRNADGYTYNDIFCGSDYLKAVENGDINDYDTVVMLSVDGAQLYRNKKSDCWIYIWIILDLAPNQRYKIRNILPGGIIPGPGHPRHLDSFFFPGLAHVSALQREGLRIYDSYNHKATMSLVFLLLALADAIAMADVSGSVGPTGKRGCRLLCEFIGRNKPNGSHYYPALLRPLGTHNSNCNHDDIDITNLPTVNPLKYQENLRSVISSRSEAEYRERRLETGIRKASIFSCLPRILEPPTCFPGDIMHQPIINLTALMFDLWCDREGCRKGDRSDPWEWAVLKGDVWKTHGQAVADAAPYFPLSFDRTPRNPAEKISSGYKAWEFLLYFYGLGPGLFYGILPEKYYRHFCKLVVAIRISYQRQISRQQLELVYKFVLEWVLEFELIYYQRKIERLHFVRQCVHSLTHLAPETDRIGPPSLSAQWTMERVIGIFGSLIKQPSNPFANLTEQAKKVAEINALVSIWPELEQLQSDPRGSIDIGAGYLLLGPKDEEPYNLSDPERTAIAKFCSGLPDAGSVPLRSVYRWGRLRLPNEQVARSYWKEVVRSKTARMDRNLKVHDLSLVLFML